MNAREYWDIFLETGAPEMYLLYKQARKMEEADVFDRSWTGASGNGLQ